MKSILQTWLNRKEKCIKISKITKSPSPDELTPIVMLQSSLYELAPIVISQSSLYEFTPIVMSQPLLYELTPRVMPLLWPFGCYFFWCFVLFCWRQEITVKLTLTSNSHSSVPPPKFWDYRCLTPCLPQNVHSFQSLK